MTFKIGLVSLIINYDLWKQYIQGESPRNSVWGSELQTFEMLVTYEDHLKQNAPAEPEVLMM